MDTDTPRGKRPRSPSFSPSSSSASQHSSPSSPSSSRSTSPAPRLKVPRQGGSAQDSSESYECHLPPTCFPLGRTFTSRLELERHQGAFHSHICRAPVRDWRKQHRISAGEGTNGTGSAGQSRNTYSAVGPSTSPIAHDNADDGPSSSSSSNAQPGWDLPRQFGLQARGQRWVECGKVFPEQRLLDLHEIECHDRAAKRRQKEGYAIFQCFVPPPACTSIFMTPKERRHHLIGKHNYPDQYFFAITNHGLNQITRDEGLGASLIRPKRDQPYPDKPKRQSNDEEGLMNGGNGDVIGIEEEFHPNRPDKRGQQNMSSDHDPNKTELLARAASFPSHTVNGLGNISKLKLKGEDVPSGQVANPNVQLANDSKDNDIDIDMEAEMDDITSKMAVSTLSSLVFVPTQLRRKVPGQKTSAK